MPYPLDPSTGRQRPGRLTMWARLKGEAKRHTPASLAFLADVVPLAICHVAHRGDGHGLVHVWSADGVLMATGSQTSPLLVFPEGWSGPGAR